METRSTRKSHSRGCFYLDNNGDRSSIYNQGDVYCGSINYYYQMSLGGYKQVMVLPIQMLEMQLGVINALKPQLCNLNGHGSQSSQ